MELQVRGNEVMGPRYKVLFEIGINGSITLIITILNYLFQVLPKGFTPKC